MIRLLLHTCVSPVSLSNSHHRSERRHLGRTMSFRSPDFVRYIHRYTHCLHPQSCTGQLVLENLLRILYEEEVLVQQVDNLKRFQSHSEVLHRPHLNPWTFTFWPSVIHSAAPLQQFSFPIVFVDPVAVSLLALVLTLYGRSRDFVDPRLLNLHLRPELPESRSAELLKEVQKVVAAGLMWKYSLTRSRSFGSSGATSLFS